MVHAEQIDPRPAFRSSRIGWRRSAVFGVIMAVIGIVAISSATTTALVTMLILGAALAIAGLVEIIQSLGRGDKGFQPLRLPGGLLSLAIGVLFLLSPARGIAAASLLLPTYFLASGLFHCVIAVVERGPKWGWDFAYGLGALALGAIAISGLPESGMWLVGTLVGIEILLRGLAIAGTALDTRRELPMAPGATA